MDEVYAYARKLTKNASEAMGMGKHIINLCLNTDMHTGRYLERLGQSVLAQSPQHKEGMQAFFEGRKPNFHEPYRWCETNAVDRSHSSESSRSLSRPARGQRRRWLGPDLRTDRQRV